MSFSELKGAGACSKPDNKRLISDVCTVGGTISARGALFDMDGLLIDNEWMYQHFWIQALKEAGFEMTLDTALGLRALTGKNAIAWFEERYGAGFPYYETRARRRELMADYIREHGLVLKKGAKECLEFLKENGFKICLATSSDREKAKGYLKITGILEYFDDMVCGDEVENGKPEPDIFIEAAKKIGLSPRECFAFEDSPNGIRAALAAGCQAVMIPDGEECEKFEELKAFGDLSIYESLTDFLAEKRF